MADLEFMHSHAPDHTTPQGTQENGVENQHEGSDINIESVIKWFAALAISSAIISVVLWGVFAYWTQHPDAPLPSQVFSGSQVPPGPHLWPDPSEGGGNPRQPLLEPQEYRQRIHAQEAAELV